jgi:pimeloyl-ACP methyl ester carboxylesterase
MTKNAITIGDVSIDYIETNPMAVPIIIFIHGNSGSSRTWEKQMNDPSFENYRLIAFDLPGHGSSAHSRNPDEDYSPLGTAMLLAKAIKEISDGKPFLLAGFSYGTNLLAEMLNCQIRPVGIAMIAMCCVGGKYAMDKVFRQSEQPSVFFYNEENRDVVCRFIRGNITRTENLNLIIDDYFQTDSRFKPALLQAAADGKLSDEMDILENLNSPVCIIFGSADKLVNIDYLNGAKLSLWNGSLNLIEGEGHFVHLDNPKEVNALLSGYARDVFTRVHA